MNVIFIMTFFFCFFFCLNDSSTWNSRLCENWWSCSSAWSKEHLVQFFNGSKNIWPSVRNSHAQSRTLLYLSMAFVKYFLFSLHHNLSLFLKPETFYFQVYVVLIVFCPWWHNHVFPQNAAIFILSYLFYILETCLRKDQNTLDL